jgi:putative glutamine transport system substrate-binding protein
MKRLGGLVLACAILLGVAGCGGSQSAPNTEKTPAGAQVSADIKAIQTKGVLRAGVKVDVPKFGYKDPKTDKIDGFEVDIVRALAKKILGDPNKIELTGINAKTRGPAIDNGEVDMVVATFTITDERKKSWNFSDSYFQDAVGLLVKKDAGIKSLADLNGKKIGVAQAATSKQAVGDAAAKLGAKVEFQEYATYPEIKAALDAGRVRPSASTAPFWRATWMIRP